MFVPPFDHPLVIAGQGTVGMEIVRQWGAATAAADAHASQASNGRADGSRGRGGGAEGGDNGSSHSSHSSSISNRSGGVGGGMNVNGSSACVVGDAYKQSSSSSSSSSAVNGATAHVGGIGISSIDDVSSASGAGSLMSRPSAPLPLGVAQEAAGKWPHAVFVPVGGGGLIAGIAAYVKALCPQVSPLTLSSRAR